MEDEIYKAHILDHFHPRHRGELLEYSQKMEGSNPSCGDTLTLFLKEKNGMVDEVSFIGEGCAISQAATSMLLQTLPGKSLTDVLQLKTKDIDALLFISVGESREKCAYLGLATLQKMCTIAKHASS